jgi:hypothetical protein
LTPVTLQHHRRVISRPEKYRAWVILGNADRRWYVPWSRVHDLDDLYLFSRMLFDLLFSMKMLFRGDSSFSRFVVSFLFSFFSSLVVWLSLLYAVVVRVVTHSVLLLLLLLSFFLLIVVVVL